MFDNNGGYTSSALEDQHRSVNMEDQMNRNVMLRVGTVVAIYYPDDSRNSSKVEIEYDVLVLQQQQNSVTFLTYRNCRVNNPFGMSNNNLTYTLQPGQQSKSGVKNGSQVSILCINGSPDSRQALIIGGVQHEGQASSTSADGQFYNFNFNGINQNINKDGELSFVFNSVIDADGKQANEEAAGTTIKFDKEGRLTLLDNEKQAMVFDRVAKTITITNESESIVINKETKNISIHAANNVEQSADKDVTSSSKGQTTLSSKKDMALNSDANMKIESKSNMSQKSNANWQVQASGNVQVKAGGNITMEAGAIAQLKGILTKLGEGTAPAGVVGLSISIGSNAGGPVISTLTTGSSTVFLGI